MFDLSPITMKVFPERWEEKFSDICMKQVVVALLFVHKPGETVVFVGSNWCVTPQKVCPRTTLPSGYGYWMCRNICNQGAHAEVDACKEAGELAKRASVVVYGHTRICENCIKIMKEYGVKKWEIESSTISEVHSYLKHMVNFNRFPSLRNSND